MKPYPVRGTLNEMLALGWGARDARQRAGLTPQAEEVLLRTWPRDGPAELTMLFQLVAAGGRVEYRSPLDAGCPQFISEKRRLRQAGHRLQPCLVLDADGEQLLCFPQVTLLAVRLGRPFRVDMLVKFRRQWFDVECDDRRHDEMVEEDGVRQSGLRLPRVGFRVADVLSPQFATRLLTRLRSLTRSWQV